MPGALQVETPRFRMLRTYDAPVAFKIGKGFHDGYIGFDVNGLPIVANGLDTNRLMRDRRPEDRARDLAAIEARTQEMLTAAQIKAVVSQQRLAADVGDIELTNAQNAMINERVIPILRGALDAPDLGDDEDAWHKWWYDRLGYQYEPAPKLVLAVNASPQLAPPTIGDCFVAGTLVRTLEGRRPIESLRVGDEVLSQDTTTGALSFQPVRVVHRMESGRTLRIALDGGETVTACVYHRFWRAGQGWAMARDLKTGDVLRTLGGSARVAAISAADDAPLYNLDVSQSRTFFVGAHDVLVHDNTLPDAHAAVFDAFATAGAEER
jgi:hypothetical protein